MKIFFSLVLGVVLCFGSVPATVMAKESTEDIYNRVIEQVENQPEQYGGIYFKDGVLHVVPTEYCIEPMSIVADTDGTEIIVDPPAQYSKTELENAFLYLRENRDELNITGYAIGIRDNGITVYAKDWTEEEKSEIKDRLNIENIEFITEGNVDYSESVPEAVAFQEFSDEEGNATKAVAPRAKIGYALNRGQTNIFYTLGRSAKDDAGNIYFLTAAHGLKVGDIMNIAATIDSDTGNYIMGELGKVVDLKMGDNMDVALIRSTEKFRPTGITNTELLLDGDSVPYEGFSGSIWTQNGPVKMEISKQRIDINWNDPATGDVLQYTDLFQMKYTTAAETKGGDSGAGISIVWEEDDAHAYVGIYKGRRILSNGSIEAYGSARKYINPYFDITSVQED